MNNLCSIVSHLGPTMIKVTIFCIYKEWFEFNDNTISMAKETLLFGPSILINFPWKKSNRLSENNGENQLILQREMEKDMKKMILKVIKRKI